MVEARRRRFAKVFLQLLQSLLGRFSLTVAIGCDARAHGSEDGPVIIVVFKRRPSAFQPIPRAIGTLKRPHAIKRLASQRMQLAGGLSIVKGQGDGGNDDFGIEARLRFLGFVIPVSGAVLEETSDDGCTFGGSIFKCAAGKQIRNIGMASGAFAFASPVDRSRVEKACRGGQREGRSVRFLRGVCRWLGEI